MELHGKVNNHNLFFAPHYSPAKTDTYTADTDTAYVYSGNELNTYGFTVHDNLILGKQRIAFGFDNNNEVNEITSFKARGEIKAPYQPRFRNTAWGIFLQSNLKLFKEKLDQIEVIENDFLDESTLDNIPKDIDAAYYLIHSMSSSEGDFQEKEKISAENFRKAFDNFNYKKIAQYSEEKLEELLQNEGIIRNKLKELM